MLPLLGLIPLVMLVLTNGVLFGVSYLLAKPIARGDRKRRILLTLAIASVVSFGPRLPSMLVDLNYSLGDLPVRSILETVTFPEGARVGLDFEVTNRTEPPNTGYPDEPKVIYREAYFPLPAHLSRNYLQESVLQGERYSYEIPRHNILKMGLTFDEKSVADDATVVKVRGREDGSHYYVDVAVSQRGKLIAEYRDRFRLRWPGNGVFKFFTQMSLLENIAAGLYPGSRSLYEKAPFSGPVHAFLSEVIHVRPETDPIPVTARAITTDIDPVEAAWLAASNRRNSEAYRSLGCTLPYKPLSGMLTYSRDGRTRFRDSNVQAGGETFSGPLAATSMGEGIASLLVRQTLGSQWSPRPAGGRS